MEGKVLRGEKRPDHKTALLDFTKEDPWRVFRIMAEFVESFETMSKQGPLIPIFGAARLKPETEYYQSAEKLAGMLVKLDFRYFFIRKVCFMKYAVAVVAYPGGFGTLDEFSEALTLMQTNKVNRVPLVLVGRNFWQPMIDWFRNVMLIDGTIHEEDMALFKLVDTAQEAYDYIVEQHKHGMTDTIRID